MSRLPRRPLAVAALVALAAFCVRAPNHPRPSLKQCCSPVARTMASDLPAGLTMPPVEASVDVVSVLAADIDADGDLDVVAADANLDLIVWANDGSGHLERVQPRHGRGLEPRPATPTIERRSGAALVSVQPDPVPFSPEHSSRAYVATPASWLLPLSSRAPSSTARRDHASRAPPASTLA